MFTRDLNQKFLSWPRSYKRIFVFSLDAIFCVLATQCAFYLRLSSWVPLFGNSLWDTLTVSLVSITISAPIFISTGFYRAIFRYSEYTALKRIIKSIALYALIFIAIFSVFGVQGVPKTVGVLQPLILLFMVGGSRVFAGYWFGNVYRKIIKMDAPSRALIYGAGLVGRQLATTLSSNSNVRVMGFVEDDLTLRGGFISGINVYAADEIDELVLSLEVTDIFLAIPFVSRSKRNQILERLRGLRVFVSSVPNVIDLTAGRIDLAEMQDLDLDDLLGRSPVLPDQKLLGKNISGKTILITGAGGSIGSELCRQILNAFPYRLLLVDNNEHALYQILNTLETIKTSYLENSVEIIPLLASIQDENRISEIFKIWRPDSVFHTAAYKHVPMVEHNSFEGIRNNVFGTWCIARISIEAQVSRFILVSTDKAVRPTNIMGASKRLAELILLALSGQFGVSHQTIFSIVRFGNVLGSSGSVIPRFRQQIRAGGPLTLTHPEVTRYFMTVGEAAQLVLQSAAMAKGGEVFLLDMGEPVKIKALAYRLIELSGRIPKDEDHPLGDIEILVTGLRPGEKLFEELLIDGDPESTVHPRIKKSNELSQSWNEVLDNLARLEKIIHAKDHDELEAFLKYIVNGYVPNKEIVDWTYRKSSLDV